MPHLILSVSQQLASHKTSLLNAALKASLPAQNVPVQLSCDMVIMNATTYGKVRVEA